MKRIRTPLALVTLLIPSYLQAQDVEMWPQWRGPRGDGISHETGLLERWPEGGPTRLWSKKVGIGFSSPIGFEGKIYLFSQESDKDVLTAFDADNGDVQWSQSYQGGYPKYSFPGGRATPAIDAGRIYTYGGGGDLCCRDLPAGAEIWRINVLQATGTQLQQWGQASCPLITAANVYVQAGQGGTIAVAINKADGASVWQSEAHGVGGYAAPILMTVEGSRQLIIFGGEAIIGMNPKTGKTLWSEPWIAGARNNATTPIAQDDRLFISSGYGEGSAMFQVAPRSVKKLWKTAEVQCKFPPPILDGGYLYCNSEDHQGTLKCLAWSDGSMKWAAKGRELKLGFGGSFVRYSDKLLTLSQRGLLSLLRATPQGVDKVSQVQLFDEQFDRVWSTPLIYRGKLYAKGEDELVCLDIARNTN